MTVWLLDAYVEDPGAARFFLPLLPEGVRVWRLVEEGPPAGVGADAVIVTGSKASANDPDAWVQGSVRWVREALGHGIPVLGVCFGHQLLGAAAGGTVRARERAEVGFLPVALADDPVLGALGSELRPFLSHGDEVVRGPSLEVMGRSEACEVQAIRVPGRLAWGIQFHVEYDRAEQERILLARAERHPELGLDVSAELARATDTREEGARLFRRFLDVTAASRPRSSDGPRG